ncbi:MAG TPA: hypothetical protein VN661_04895 [Candidatus Acidoferrales bacterium]|nr:hypothetical protein [Candidatus Acidoferrales bacterium]
MKPFELAFIFADLLVLAASLLSARAWRRWMSAASVAALLFAAAQFHAVHWQMYPAYAAAAALCAWTCFRFSPRRRLPLAANLVSIFLLLASLGLGFLFPVFSLPRPTGPFAIGTITRQWVRIAPPAEVAAGSSRDRRLTVQFWYPAAPGAKGKLAPYRTGDGFAFHARYLSLVATHARIGAPVSASQPLYPVVLFSPMWNSGRSQNTVQFEMLASNGFVVAAIEHPLDSNDPHFDYSSDEKLREKDRQLDRRAADARFVLGQLEHIADKLTLGPLAGRLDLSRIGFFGHSFGGATAEETCWLDSRCKAGVNMDGTQFGGVAAAGIAQPFMFMFSDSPLPSAAELDSANPSVRYTAEVDQRDYKRIAESLARRGGYRLTLHGSSHLNYTDRPLFSPWRRLTDSGPLDARLAEREINAYLLAFFEKYLNGKPEPLLQGSSSPYTAVSFRSFSPPVRAARVADPPASPAARASTRAPAQRSLPRIHRRQTLSYPVPS